MNIALLLEMAAEGAGQRVALGPRSGGVSYAELLRLARNAGEWLASQPGQRPTLARAQGTSRVSGSTRCQHQVHPCGRTDGKRDRRGVIESRPSVRKAFAV